MPKYEHIFIARQDVSTAQVETLTGELTKIVEDLDGRVVKNEYWGLRPLAYRVKKNRKGHYVLLNIDAPYPAVAEMERQAGINEDIIRFMTIRVDDLEEGPSIFLRSKPERSDRRGGREGGGRDGGREGGRDGARDGGRPGGYRDGGRDGGREGGRDGQREYRERRD
ncbi:MULTISPECIES: 30S ribosomal protein S6 [unclassified Iodidimonas]|jgi:small subunit ribosomal protein S6|uniref:30S ribosomal protein S6 n=1 Tax=unclassified Iodidimonas TaxID=2626145 RepID=UPI0024829166|nr:MULTISPECIES: 30S ribosomal protein S6 [unclassified Iodidimonas]